MNDALAKSALNYAESVKALNAAQKVVADFQAAMSRVDTAPMLGTYFKLTPEVKTVLLDQVSGAVRVATANKEHAEDALQAVAKEF